VVQAVGGCASLLPDSPKGDGVGVAGGTSACIASSEVSGADPSPGLGDGFALVMACNLSAADASSSVPSVPPEFPYP
jgi:hypothetical protein